MKKILMVLLTGFTLLSLSACDDVSAPTTVQELYDAVTSTSPNYSFNMKEDDEEVIMKFDSNKAYMKMSSGNESVEAYTSVKNNVTTAYIYDESIKSWITMELDENNSNMFDDLDVDSYVEENGFMVSESDETAFKFVGNNIYAYQYEDGKVLIDGVVIKFYDFGTTSVTLPNIEKPEGGVEDTEKLQEAIDLINTSTNYETFVSIDMGVSMGLDENIAVMEVTVKLNGDKYQEIQTMKTCIKVDSNGEMILDENGNPVLDLDSDGNRIFTEVTVETFVVNNYDDTYDVYAINEFTGQMELTENVPDNGVYSTYFVANTVELNVSDFTQTGNLFTTIIYEMTELGPVTNILVIDLSEGLSNMEVNQTLNILGMTFNSISYNYEKTTVTLPTVN